MLDPLDFTEPQNDRLFLLVDDEDRIPKEQSDDRDEGDESVEAVRHQLEVPWVEVLLLRAVPPAAVALELGEEVCRCNSFKGR